MLSIRKPLFTLILLWLNSFLYGQSNFIELDREQEVSLKAQADSMAKAFIQGDFTSFAKFTYPKAVQMLGGKDKMIEILQKGIQEMKSQNATFKSVLIGNHLDAIKAENELHTYIAQRIEMSVPNGTLVVNSYLLSISKDNGKTWYFIDSSPLTKESIKNLLPNYNLLLKIPPKQKPIFNQTQ